jgi:hypothetical protein
LSHAVAGMALAGAMMASREASHHDVRLAMLGGLLHDIGEVYINPQYLDYNQALDIVGHKHLVVHPRVAQVLLSTLTDYPAALCQAVAEHHERLDRSGYPARLGGESVSTIGRVLAVVEVTLGSLCALNAPLTRASFALRVVPGEFDPVWASFVCDAAQEAGEDFEGESQPVAPTLAAQLADIDHQLAEARQLALDLSEQRRVSKITEDPIGEQLALRESERLASEREAAYAELRAASARLEEVTLSVGALVIFYDLFRRALSQLDPARGVGQFTLTPARLRLRVRSLPGEIVSVRAESGRLSLADVGVQLLVLG